MLIFENATQAWEGLYQDLSSQASKGFLIPSRAGNVVGELINATIIIDDPTRGIVESNIRNMDIRYALGELMFYLSGSNKLSDINQYSKFWNKLSSDGETVNSAYGHRIHYKFGFDQWEQVKAQLIADKHSRQAIIHIKEPTDCTLNRTQDLPCTLALQFQIREGALYMSTMMRSNDIWLGFPFDVFCFTALQVKMAMELGVSLGDYTHFVGSLHLYERNYVGGEKIGAFQSTVQSNPK